MGTTRELIKVDKDETYDLGKALGYSFPTDKPFILQSLYPTKDDFKNQVNKDLDSGWGFSTKEEKETYAQWLVDNIWDWCGHDRLLCSTNGDYEENIDYYVKKFGCLEKDYYMFRETGSRYKESND